MRNLLVTGSRVSIVCPANARHLTFDSDVELRSDRWPHSKIRRLTPAADSDEAQQSLRGLADDTRSITDPHDIYPSLGCPQHARAPLNAASRPGRHRGSPGRLTRAAFLSDITSRTPRRPRWYFPEGCLGGRQSQGADSAPGVSPTARGPGGKKMEAPGNNSPATRGGTTYTPAA